MSMEISKQATKRIHRWISVFLLEQLVDEKWEDVDTTLSVMKKTIDFLQDSYNNLKEKRENGIVTDEVRNKL